MGGETEMSEEPLDLRGAEIDGDEIEARPALTPVPSWVIAVAALLAFLAWAAVSAFVLANNPTEGERSGILEQAKLFASAAVFYYLGSSAGSRNKDITR